MTVFVRSNYWTNHRLWLCVQLLGNSRRVNGKKITKIGNYHYNFGAGQDPTAVNGKISIYDAVSGALIGSWAASTVENTDDLGFTCLGPNMCWGAHPNVTLKAGTGLWIQTLPPGPTQ